MIILTSFQLSQTKSTVDDSLIKKIAAGDGEAFHTLYQAAYGGVYGFALSITKNPHDADDVLQDTFLAVYQNAAEYIPQGKPMAWIFTIARNFALSRLRAVAKEPIAEEFLIENQKAFSKIEGIEERETLRAMLNALAVDERQVVMLHASGFKNREIADILGLKLATVLSKHARAIKKLKAALKEEDL